MSYGSLCGQDLNVPMGWQLYVIAKLMYLKGLTLNVFHPAWTEGWRMYLWPHHRLGRGVRREGIDSLGGCGLRGRVWWEKLPWEKSRTYSHVVRVGYSSGGKSYHRLLWLLVPCVITSNNLYIEVADGREWSGSCQHMLMYCLTQVYCFSYLLQRM